MLVGNAGRVGAVAGPAEESLAPRLAPVTCPACGGSLAPWRTVPGSEPDLGAGMARRGGTIAVLARRP